MNFFEFDENLAFEDESIPGLISFYRHDAIKVLHQAGVKRNFKPLSDAQLLNLVQQAAAKGHLAAQDLLPALYHEGFGSSSVFDIAA